MSVKSYKELEHEFVHGSNPDFPLHPGDLKNAVVGFLNRLDRVFPVDFFVNKWRYFEHMGACGAVGKGAGCKCT